MADNSANKDLEIAFAGIIASMGERCPDKSPVALVGAGIISGIALAENDAKLMGRVLDKAIPSDQLEMTRASAKKIVEMFRELERVGKLIAALPQ